MVCVSSVMSSSTVTGTEKVELDSARVWFSQGNTIKLEKGKGVEIVCKGEIKVIGYRVQDADRISSEHNNFQVFLFLKYY